MLLDRFIYFLTGHCYVCLQIFPLFCNWLTEDYVDKSTNLLITLSGLGSTVRGPSQPMRHRPFIYVIYIITFITVMNLELILLKRGGMDFT